MASKTKRQQHRGFKVIRGGKPKAKANCPACHSDIELGGGVIVGARCGNPRPGYDIYIGLDKYTYRLAPHPYPWEGDRVEIQFCFPIADMGTPDNIIQFAELIYWMCTQLQAGKRIHIGCIGGHGRTGLVLAALRKHVDNDTNAGAWVRKNHCEHAIETQQQVDWLYKHFGIKKVKPSKEHFIGFKTPPLPKGAAFEEYAQGRLGDTDWEPELK